MVRFDGPKTYVYWKAVSGEGNYFQVTLEEFIRCAVFTTNEQEFRAELYRCGKFTKRIPDNHKQAAAAMAGI